MSHNLLFIVCLTVLPVLTVLCVLITCARAVNTNVESRQTPPPPPPPSSTQSAQQPVVAKRRSRTQETLRSEYELSKYPKPIIKHNDGQTD